MSDLAINLSNICKKYPHFELSDINLKLPKGQIMGLIGPNGAGKSTSIRIMMGLVHQDRGHAQVMGHAMPAEQVCAKRDIGFASEDMRLYKYATLQWHIDFIKSIFTNWDEAYAKKLIQTFGLVPQQKIKGYSHGQRVKAGLLLVLARKPKLMILDEPTTGLDPVARHQVLSELTEVLADDERSILFSSHNTQDIEQLSDQITFIDNGRIIESQNKETYLEQWRRIRLEVPGDFKFPKLAGLVETQKSGHLAVVTTKQFNQSQLAEFQNQGAKIQNIETMTLEEIFVTEVNTSRTGERT